MSLYVCDKYDVENGIINDNDIIKETSIYFDNNVILANSSEVRDILNKIDGGSYIDEVFFNGHLGHMGIVSKKYLSAGCKVAMCVNHNKDRIFSTAACGYNALYYILTHDYGKIFIVPKMINAGTDINVTCDIEYKNKKFKKLSDFYRWRWLNGYSK